MRKHTSCPWVLLYIERLLEAPVQMADGSLVGRERGTPQGSVISPLLANLFLHYAFDLWMSRNYPDIPFERFADDAICHCRNEEQALALRAALEERFAECGLELHPEKTQIVYCKDEDRRGDCPNQSSTSSAIRFGRGWRDGGRVESASRSARRSAARRSKRFGAKFGAGSFRSAVTSRWMIWLGCSTP